MRYFHGLFEFKLFSLIYIASDSIKFQTLSVLNIVNGFFRNLDRLSSRQCGIDNGILSRLPHLFSKNNLYKF